MGNYINDEVVEDIKNAANIVDLISEYLPLEKSGANYVGLCPFHLEKTPSFTVSPNKEFYHCFGCGESGDIFEFIMKRENFTFPESIEFLANKYGIEIRELSKEEKKKKSRREYLFEINREAAKFFLLNLENSRKAKKYLEDRGIKRELRIKFGLGYAEDSWSKLYEYLTDKGYKEEDLEELGLIARKKSGRGYYDKFRNRIIFPIIDNNSRVLGFGGRVLDDSMPKYLNSQETPIFSKRNTLFGINMLDKYAGREEVILVEGYMDVLALFKNNIYSGLASLGTALTENQVNLMKRYGKDIYICFDSDLAGIKATESAIRIMLGQGIKPKIIDLGEFKDPDDFFEENNRKDFEMAMKNSLNFLDYKIKINKNRYDLKSLDGKINFTKIIAEEISLLKNPIEKDVYINQLSIDLNIDKDAIKQEVDKNYKRSKFPKPVNSFKNINKDKIKTCLRAEMELLKISIFDKKYYNLIRSKDIFKVMENKTCLKVLNLIEDLYEIKDSIDKKKLYDIIQSGEDVDKEIIKNILSENYNYPTDNLGQMIEELYTTLKINKLKERRKTVRDKIQQLETSGDKIDRELVAGLLAELLELNGKIDKIRFEDRR